MGPVTGEAPTPRPPLVVVSPLPPQLEAVADLLVGAGCRVRRLPDDPAFTWTPDTIAEWLGPADALVGIFGRAPIGGDALDGAPRLRVVTSPIIGTETIDVAACTERGIVVGFGATPENYEGMAEAVVMLVAALRKRLVPKMAAAADGSWRPAGGVGHLVGGATVGLVGFGAIGRATAARLSGWGCRLLATDPVVDDDDLVAAGVEPVGLDELLERSDVVSLAVTLSDATRHLIDAEALARMKPGALLVNAARGGLVDEAALLAALDDGHLAGAAIDTWESEGPGTTSPLRGHRLVIATGHNVGHSAELYASHPPAARDNTVLALAGRDPRHVRNPEVLTGWRARVAALQRSHPLTLPARPAG
jgi:phosphoglycerate dehydrogenase-like enzyme